MRKIEVVWQSKIDQGQDAKNSHEELEEEFTALASKITGEIQSKYKVRHLENYNSNSCKYKGSHLTTMTQEWATKCPVYTAHSS